MGKVVSASKNGERLTHQPPVVSTVRGVILAGSHSWGACALEQVIPRSLAPIVNRPLIQYAIDWFDQAGIDSVAICGNVETSVVRHRLSRGLVRTQLPQDVRIDFYQDIAPRGPAGCVRDAANDDYFDTYVVTEGSVLPQIDLERLLDAHAKADAAVTVVVSSGAAVGESNSDLIAPIGIYVFSRQAIEQIAPMGYQDIKETLIPKLYVQGEMVQIYRTDVPPLRVTGADSYLAVNDVALVGQLARNEFSDIYRRQDECMIHKTARVDESATLIGPILIGADSVVEPGTTIVGPTTVGRRCRLGGGSVITRSSLWDDSFTDESVVLDRCIVTAGMHATNEAAHRYRVFAQVRDRQRSMGQWLRRWISPKNGRNGHRDAMVSGIGRAQTAQT